MGAPVDNLLNTIISNMECQNWQGIIVGGCTGSGKSNLALNLAVHLNGIIINGDAVQLYKHIPILSAAPSKVERETIEHHLYEIFDPWDQTNAAIWLNQVVQLISVTIDSGKIPIVVGGTGMYLQALINGLSPTPNIPTHISKHVAELLQTTDKLNFYNHVISCDPLIVDLIMPNDQQRLQRALEVFLTTNQSIVKNKANKRPPTNLKWGMINLIPDVEKLNKLLAPRIAKMLNNGAICEVENLKKMGIDLSAPICKAIGVCEIWQLLDNQINTEQANELMLIKTRQYAKRQRTFFRNQFANCLNFDQIYINSQSMVNN